MSTSVRFNFVRLHRRVLGAAGIAKRATPHTLQQYFATHLQQAGSDIRNVSCWGMPTLQPPLSHARAARRAVRPMHSSQLRHLTAAIGDLPLLAES